MLKNKLNKKFGKIPSLSNINAHTRYDKYQNPIKEYNSPNSYNFRPSNIEKEIHVDNVRKKKDKPVLYPC